MVPELDRSRLLPLAVCAAAAMASVAGIAAKEPTSGKAAVAGALVLAPLAVAAVAAAAARIGSGRFAVAAAALYVLLPYLGNRLVLGTGRSSYDARALPALVGTERTGVLALGIAALALVALLPDRIAAALGAVGLVVALVVWTPGALGHVPPMLHETAWSVAFPEWLVGATIAAVLLRRPFVGVALGAIAVAAILRASHGSLEDAGFWRSLGPLVPVGAVLLASLRLLVPRLGTLRVRRAAA